ncbi:hypothetical protein SKAU_G00316340 [Synaphobranchus kaupii]|uniref:Uncharacterized protein n=1 Tax=Synaphobranchus kaupii TaxID=118154 RepID=A0A9Q1ILV6_SYNKA|nr:hypothetical protein SKAU_G00316340 [Synaphobranchus kaupii]
MTYESVVTGFFPFFLVATVIQLFYRGRLWNILLFLLTVQLVGVVKAGYACFLRGSVIFALLTINQTSWGTSGRRKIVVNFMGAVPVTVWAGVLLGGVAYTIYCETQAELGRTEASACWWQARRCTPATGPLCWRSTSQSWPNAATSGRSSYSLAYAEA